MLATVVRNKQLRLVRRPLPRLRPGWALVRVRLAGICNTDLEILRGYHGFRGTPGHEFVGEVARLEPARTRRRNTQRVRVGDRVVGEINIACTNLGYARPCAYCRRGLPTHCLRRRVLGILNHDGAFADYVALPLANLHRVPDGLSDEQAVFTEPLAAACEILEQVRVAEHRQAAVLGGGKLGQLIARVLKSAGVGVVLFARHANQLKMARRAGVRAVRSVGTAPRQQCTLVVEATGSPAGLAQALGMVAPRGTLVLKSTFHGAANLETWPMVVHEITLVGSRCGPFRRALELLRRRRVDPRPLITRTFRLREAPAAIRYAARPGVLKVLLRP